jgi:hypothetical protein
MQDGRDTEMTVDNSENGALTCERNRGHVARVAFQNKDESGSREK